MDRGESARSSSVQNPEEGKLLRRGISLFNNKGGPRTPVPTWKLEEEEEEEESDVTSSSELRRGRVAPGRSSVSARKLGANLWEIQGGIKMGESRISGGGDDDEEEEEGGDDVSEISRRSHQDRSAGTLRRHVSAPFIPQHKLKGKKDHTLQPVSSATYSSSVEVAAVDHVASYSNSFNLKGMVGEDGYSLKTSTELLKLLNRIWSLEEQQVSNESIVKALKVELKQARARVQQLMHEHKAFRHEMDDLMKQVAEDKLIRKRREQDKIKMAVQSIQDELEDERRLRKRSESLHRKLGKELSEVKAALSRAHKDLDREKEANGLLEDLCDEFAKGVGDYELESRDCDHKADCMVLHISEAWLDGRLQMKVAEARGEVDEKNKILNSLSQEIMKFLQTKRSSSARNDISLHKNGSLRRQSLESLHFNGATSAPQDGEDDDSIASDVHCFELNLGENSLEKIDEAGLSTVRRKSKTAYFDRTKGQSSSNSQVSCNGNNMQFMDRIHVIHSRKDADIEGKGAEEGCLNMRMDDAQLDLLIDNSVKKQLGFSEGRQDHHDYCNGKEFPNQFLRRGQTVSNTRENASGSFYSLSSPVQQWRNLLQSPNSEISECSSKLPKGVKENTLKAKLLEARLEGQYARLKASKTNSTMEEREQKG